MHISGIDSVSSTDMDSIKSVSDGHASSLHAVPVAVSPPVAEGPYLGGLRVETRRRLKMIIHAAKCRWSSGRTKYAVRSG